MQRRGLADAADVLRAAAQHQASPGRSVAGVL